MNQVPSEVVFVELVEIEIPEVVVGDFVGKHVIDGHQDLMGHRHNCSFVPTATMALAHSMVEIAHTLLSKKVHYQDLGPDYFLQLNRKAVERRCVRQLQQLGYRVALTPEKEAA